MIEPPADIWILIAADITDRQSLARLCSVNSQAAAALHPLLYKRIRLGGYDKAHLLCTSIINSKSPLGEFIYSLTFSSTDEAPCDIPEFPQALRSALGKMPNLKHFSFNHQGDVVDSMLKGFSPPFKLRSFTSLSHVSPHVIDFLISQPSIEKLGLQGCQKSTEHLARLNPDGLPALTTVNVPNRFFDILIPGRPVSRVNGIYELVQGERLSFEPLIRSTVPVTMLSYDIRHNPYMPFAFTGTWISLSHSQVKENIKNFYIACGRVDASTQEQGFACIVLFFPTLKVLPALERFEFGCDKASLQEPEWISTRLGSLAWIDGWRCVAPRLKSAKVYGFDVLKRPTH